MEVDKEDEIVMVSIDTDNIETVGFAVYAKTKDEAMELLKEHIPIKIHTAKFKDLDPAEKKMLLNSEKGAVFR